MKLKLLLPKPGAELHLSNLYRDVSIIRLESGYFIDYRDGHECECRTLYQALELAVAHLTR